MHLCSRDLYAECISKRKYFHFCYKEKTRKYNKNEKRLQQLDIVRCNFLFFLETTCGTKRGTAQQMLLRKKECLKQKENVSGQKMYKHCNKHNQIIFVEWVNVLHIYRHTQI